MQITFKPIIIQGGARKGGTSPVYIRVYFAGRTRRLPTTLTCAASDLTRTGRIKSPAILASAEDLIRRMRAALGALTYFELEDMDVDAVVERIRDAVAADAFRLDFFEFAGEFISPRKEGTADSYVQALAALERYLGRRQLDINDITKAMLQDFGAFVDAEKRKGVRVPGRARGVYVSKLSTIFEAAKAKFNDEDAGRIRIPRSPFRDISRKLPPAEGQRALPAHVFQQLIDDADAGRGAEGEAFAAFLVSFMTMGANIADLWEAPAFQRDVWTYNRRKTRDRRADRAEVQVQIPPELRPWLARLRGPERRWWLPALHRHGSPRAATSFVNYHLRGWADRHGLPRFTFYAARKTWATLARRCGVEKATVDEALGHVGEFRLADIYAERNWALAWDANRRVLDMFRWPEN